MYKPIFIIFIPFFLPCPQIPDTEIHRILNKDTISQDEAIDILDPMRSSSMYYQFLSRLHATLDHRTTPLMTNLMLASASVAYPHHLNEAYKHARDRCIWVLFALETFPLLDRNSHISEQPPQISKFKRGAYSILQEIYQNGGYGVDKDLDKAALYQDLALANFLNFSTK